MEKTAPGQPRILLLHGDDDLAIAGHVKKLCAELGDPVTAEMNTAHFEKEQINYEAISTAINSSPFIAPLRVVVLADFFGRFYSKEEYKKHKEETDRYLELFIHAPATTLILLVENETLKKDHWLLGWIKKHETEAGLHLYSLPKKWDMPRWIESEVIKQKGKIEPGAASRLGEMVGNDTRIAAQEITKLLAYVNYARPISMADVEKVSFFCAQESIFDLVDALGLGKGKQAQQILHRLLEVQDANEIWGMIIRQFRLLIQARELLDGGASTAQIQQTLDIHEFVAGKVSEQARRFSLPALAGIYHTLLEIDEKSKNGQAPLDLSLDTLVLKVAGVK